MTVRLKLLQYSHVEVESRLTFVLNGVARSMAPSGLKMAVSFCAIELASREQCERDVEPESIVTLPVKEELGVDFAVSLGMEVMVR